MSGLLASLRASGRLGLLLIGFVLIAIGVLLLCWAKAAYDRRLIAAHEGARAVEVMAADRAADAGAAAQRRTDDARLSAEADALEKVTDNATDPVAARRAYHACIRVQQQARSAGRVTPAC